MTAKAEQAFADYVALGANRSLAKLADAYVHDGSCTVKVAQLERWSAKYGWQARLRLLAEAKLNEANTTRADIYLRMVQEYDRRTRDGMAAAMRLGDLHGVHDRVKFPDPQRIQHEGNPDAPIVFNFIRDGGDRADE